VDAFSDDGTAEKLFEWASADETVKVIQEKGAAAHGRNLAIRNSKYEIILSTDMGVRLSSNWCEELIKPFETDPDVDVVAGNTCIDPESSKTATARAEYYYENSGFAKLEPGFIIGNRSSAYRKKIWRDLNGLSEDLTFYADDSVFGRQIIEKGYRMAFAPNALTYWSRPKRLSQFYREQFVYGRGDGEALIKTPLAFKLHQKGFLAKGLVPLTHALIQLFKGSFHKGIFRALKKSDPVAALFIPLLIPVRGFHYARGYLVGNDIGVRNCLQCRSRLRRDSDGYSLY
jgi:cellulose synthase/poly-beta-1,6-N-acetylglucosamine synthase-like glycosyltransferase